MADLSAIDKFYDNVVRGMPYEKLVEAERNPASVEAQIAPPTQAPATTPQETDNSDLWTQVITSFAPAALGALTGEAGALAAPVAQKQAREQYDAHKKELLASQEKERERALKQRDWDLKLAELTTKKTQQDLDNTRKDRDSERADEKLEIDRQSLSQKIKESKSVAKDPELKAATELRKEFNSRPEVKRFSEVSTAFDKVQQAADNPSAAGDLSLIFGYMKMLDPGSTVREGEFANAQNAGGIPDRVVNMYNKAKNGERLNPEQRQQFIGSARQAYDAELSARQSVESEFGSLAGKYQIDPNLVFSNARQPKGLKSEKPQDPQIANYAKQYGLTYQKAESIINNRRGN